MAILSKRIMTDVSRDYFRTYGLRPLFTDLNGAPLLRRDPWDAVPGVRRRRNYALQESVNLGRPYVFEILPAVWSWVVGLEDKRLIHGAAAGGEVLSAESADRDAVAERLVEAGIAREQADPLAQRLPVWERSAFEQASGFLQETFYRISGWRPVLLEENRVKALRQQQLNQAIEDQKRRGAEALYAFEKERVLLAHIRSGDRNGARRILNEMLAVIYMSSPRLVVLRARAIELISCLTRAAIEDNPLLEPLIERNHTWTEQIIRARVFEELSQALMDALDEFIDGIYLHGANRSNTKVSQALEFISANFARRIALAEVADHVGLSVCRLSHLVKEFTGRTVVQIVHEVRVRHAQQLLERSSRSCTEIAYDVGFNDQSYFTKQFKRLTGTTPQQYRRALKVPRAGAKG